MSKAYYPTRDTVELYKVIERAWPNCCPDNLKVLNIYVANIRKKIPQLSEANAREIVAVIAEWIFYTQPRGTK